MSQETNLQVGIKSSPEEIFKALTETEQLARWWTSDTRGSGSKVGNTLEFWFGNFCQKFEVTAIEPGKLVSWTAMKEGIDQWAGTEVTFALATDNAQTYVHFRHSGWREKTDFFAHCSMKWATFLLSLKDMLENGKGRPAPNDLAINYR